MHEVNDYEFNGREKGSLQRGDQVQFAPTPSYGNALFWQRVRESLVYNYQLIKSSLDWTVWAYILIPLLLVAGYHYGQALNQTAQWPHFFNPISLGVILAFFCAAGKLRTYLHPADQLLLWQRRALIDTLIKKGRHLYFVKSIGATLLFFVLLFPVLKNYLGYTWLELVTLVIFVWLSKLAAAYLKQWFDFSWTMPVGLALKGILLVAGLVIFPLLLAHFKAAYFPGMIFLPLSCLVLGHWLLKRKPLPFEKACALEMDERLKYVRLLLAQTSWLGSPEYVHKKRSWLWSKPFIFRRSQALFKELNERKGLMELTLKTFLRNITWLSLYFQLGSVATLGLILLPFWLKLILWLLVMAALSSVLKSYWISVLAHPYLNLFSWPKDRKYKAGQASLFWLMFPLGLYLSVLCGYLMLSVWGVGLMIPIGIGFMYLAANWHASSLPQ